MRKAYSREIIWSYDYLILKHFKTSYYRKIARLFLYKITSFDQLIVYKILINIVHLWRGVETSGPPFMICNKLHEKKHILFYTTNIQKNKKQKSHLPLHIIELFYKQPRPVSTLLKGLIRWLVHTHYNPKAITKTECSTLILNKREPVLRFML